jgi:hypothetical protein
MTDPRSGHLLPSVAQPGAAPSAFQPEPLQPTQLLQAAWAQLHVVLDLVTERYVRLRPIDDATWRAECQMCGRRCYVDLSEHLHVIHTPDCLMARMALERRRVDQAFGLVLDVLSQQSERRQPDTQERMPAAAEQPSPGLEPGGEFAVFARIGAQLDAIAAGKVAAQ